MIPPPPRKIVFCLLVMAACSAALPRRGAAELTYRPGEGVTYTAPGQEEVPNKRDAQAQFDTAFAAESKGDLASAIGGYRKTVRRFPRSQVAASAQFRMGLLLEKQGSLVAAFKCYEKLVKDYPTSTDFDKALEGEFRIGTSYVEGYRQKVVGIPTLPSMNQAVVIFTSIIKSAPYSKFAPLAQFNIGQAKEKDGDLKAAVEAYQKLVDKYPTNPSAADAQYQIGFVWMRISQTGSYDAKAAQHARESFEDFLAQYPNNEKAPQARENLANLGNQQTGGSYKIARYYDKQGLFRAAIVYYNDVIRESPKSKESDYAKARLAVLRAKYGDSATVTAPGTPTGDNRVQARQDTARRPDYNGPPVSAPPPPAPIAAASTGTGSQGASPGAPITPLPLPPPIPDSEQPSLPSGGTAPPALNLSPGSPITPTAEPPSAPSPSPAPADAPAPPPSAPAGSPSASPSH